MTTSAQPQAPAHDDKVTIGAYVSLIFAIVFFSGLCATKEWWGIFDFTTMNGSFGTLVASVADKGGELTTSMANFRGKGGSGAIDGFMFALTLVPTVMFALAMITVFEHYGALRAARQMLTPILRPILGLPGSATLAPRRCGGARSRRRGPQSDAPTFPPPRRSGAVRPCTRCRS